MVEFFSVKFVRKLKKRPEKSTQMKMRTNTEEGIDSIYCHVGSDGGSKPGRIEDLGDSLKKLKALSSSSCESIFEG